MPTKIVSGQGGLARCGALAQSIGMAKPLVVTDAVIAKQDFCKFVVQAIEEAGLRYELFEDCAVDARLQQAESLAGLCRRKGLDGVLAIGGGSVMCCGKATAISAVNEGSLRDYAFPRLAPRHPLPTLMIPTTAGSGVEVSQFSVLKDEELHEKLIVGGASCFPTLALLDPATLASLPKALAAASAVDALCHALEAYFSSLATPLTDSIAIGSAKTLYNCMRKSVLDRDLDAQADNLLASSMANIACGNARLGLGHALSDPLESHLDVPHTVGVSVLLPRVVAFCAEAAPAKATIVAQALGGVPGQRDPIDHIRRSLFDLYDDLGLRKSFSLEQLPLEKASAIAALAVPGLYGGMVPHSIDNETLINSPALRSMTVKQARECLLACLSE
ncbi:iron-containing alcohol dehydrogenase [Sphingobium sp. SCG-1]|uniref:iron-containing alcohol dehydrogenase n=1 Tax=Sphingobium sp. SCG-1 TaxID=2072936 RepID=UPI0016716B41|nr:iron-containing alcohol dehydrogenase [Sphingobium sp. SCG-1]